MKAYIITLHMWDIDLHIQPEPNTRYEVHKSAVYPFRCVAEDVAKRMPRMADWPAYVVKEIEIEETQE